MRMQCLVLLVLALFCAGFEAAEALVRSEQGTSSSATTRLLRSDEAAAVDDTGKTITSDGEERAPIGEWVSRLAVLDQKTSKFRKFDMKLAQTNWLYRGKKSEFLFKYLNILGAWRNIDNSKRTMQWFRFVMGYRAKWGPGSYTDYQIYHLLRTEVSEAKLATVFASLKQIPDLKTLAESMQNYQLKLWVSRRETSASVAKILGIPHTSPLNERGVNDEILSAFTTMLKEDGRTLKRSATLG